MRHIAKYFFYSYSDCPKPNLSEDQKLVRLNWCLGRRHWTVDQWKHVLFTDEMHCSEHDHKKVWFVRTAAMKNDPKFRTKTKSHGGFCVSVWGGVSAEGLTELFISGDDSDRWNRLDYIKIIRNYARPMLDEHDLTLQQDNAPIHNAEDTLHAFDLMGIDLMSWPPYSPDLNLIENLWGIIKGKLPAVLYQTRDEFIEAIRAAWASISPEII